MTPSIVGYPAVSFWGVYHQGFVTPQLTHLGRSMEADRQMPRRKIAFPLPDVPEIWWRTFQRFRGLMKKRMGKQQTKAEDAQKKTIFESSIETFWSTLPKKLTYLPKKPPCCKVILISHPEKSQAGDSRSFSNNSWRPWKANCAAACKTMDTWHQVADMGKQQNRKWTRWVINPNSNFQKGVTFATNQDTYL